MVESFVTAYSDNVPLRAFKGRALVRELHRRYWPSLYGGIFLVSVVLVATFL
jgi:hypothetical protein